MHIVRRIRCPFCNNDYTEFLQMLNYTIPGQDGRWEKTHCPKCGTEVYVSGTADYMLPADDIQDAKDHIVIRKG